MNETPFFFDRQEHRLFAIYHDPGGAAPRLPMLLCHPFGEEKLWAHRVYVNFARELAAHGHPVLRFDYMGNGDSIGAFVESSIESALADIHAAATKLKALSRSESIGLVGLRLGASLAFRTAASREDVRGLVMWAPIANGERYLQELLRINLTTQMAVYREVREDREALAARLASGEAVNVDGYEISPSMAQQLSGLSLLSGPVPERVPMLLVQIERSEQARPAKELESLQQRMPLSTLTIVQEEPFWKEIQRFYDRAPNLYETTGAFVRGL